MNDYLHSLKSRLILAAALAMAIIGGSCGRAGDPAVSNSNSGASAGSTPNISELNAGIESEIVTPQVIEDSIKATGKIQVTEDRVATIGPVHEGRIVKLFAGQGNAVKKGQILAELESADIDQAEADFLKAQADQENARRSSAAEIKFAQATYDRTKLLFEKEITAGKNLQQAEHDLEVAKANGENAVSSAKVAVENARRQLLIFGLSESAIRSLASKRNLGSSRFSLTAPISGIVVERNGTIGSTVGTDANLFKIIDLSSVWIDADVFEKDLERVKTGQLVNITATAFPGSTFTGRVILISSVVDPETRTVKVRTEVPNADGRLRPDMFANVEIIASSRKTAISIPMSAVLDDGGRSVVFVADGNSYKKRDVTLGVKGEERVEITDGLKEGERVVVKGNYLLMEQSRGDQ